MVQLNTVRACNKALFQLGPITAVVVGGASGIGEYAVHAIAAAHGSSGRGLRLYIVGRNEEAAKANIARCQAVCPSGDFRFIRANDLSLLRDVDRVCKEIADAEDKAAAPLGRKASIDLLVMTQALFAFGKGLEHRLSDEGLEKSLSLLYYSRMRFVFQLLPLLTSSLVPGGGRVVSVFSPGRDQKLILDDLSLQTPQNFNFTILGSHSAYMTTFFFEHLAAAHPGKLSLSHFFPGIVLTPAYRSKGTPGWFRIVFPLLTPLVTLMAVSPSEVGQRILFHTSPRFPARDTPGAEAAATRQKVKLASSSDSVSGGGAYRSNWNGDESPLTKQYEKLNKNQVSEQVWKHTMKVFGEIKCSVGEVWNKSQSGRQGRGDDGIYTEDEVSCVL